VAEIDEASRVSALARTVLLPSGDEGVHDDNKQPPVTLSSAATALLASAVPVVYMKRLCSASVLALIPESQGQCTGLLDELQRRGVIRVAKCASLAFLTPLGRAWHAPFAKKAASFAHQRRQAQEEWRRKVEEAQQMRRKKREAQKAARKTRLAAVALADTTEDMVGNADSSKHEQPTAPGGRTVVGAVLLVATAEKPSLPVPKIDSVPMEADDCDTDSEGEHDDAHEIAELGGLLDSTYTGALDVDDADREDLWEKFGVDAVVRRLEEERARGAVERRREAKARRLNRPRTHKPPSHVAVAPSSSDDDSHPLGHLRRRRGRKDGASTSTEAVLAEAVASPVIRFKAKRPGTATNLFGGAVKRYVFAAALVLAMAAALWLVVTDTADRRGGFRH
jgi:hypothetical protein